MSHVISARVGDDQYLFLTRVAKKRKRKLSEIFIDALDYYLDEFADYSIALERLHDPSHKIISGDEMLKQLGLTKDDLRDKV